MTARVATAVLEFDPAQDVLPSGKRLSGGMSAVTAVGDTLWLAHDETVAIERLRATPAPTRSLRYADHRRFDIRAFIPLPATKVAVDDDAGFPEADVEGLAYADGYLWLVGSHSAHRDDPEGPTTRDAIRAFANIRRSGNRFLLARIPVVKGDDERMLARRYVDARRGLRTAARLPGGRKQNDLTRALRDDPHLGPFLSLPSKDNGFDIEGLAAAPGGRLFLGLRGPVIDGWACVLEIRVGTRRLREHELVLEKVDGTSAARHRKHFLDLGGAGVRDICLAGRDLLILTGPPMRGKGATKVRCWKNALGARAESLIDGKRLRTLLELRYRADRDHPEGLAILGMARRRARAIVVYDSAERTPSLPRSAMRATLHDLSLP